MSAAPGNVEALWARTVFAPVPVRNAFEVTVERLAQSIRLGVLSAGDRLPPERELAETFDEMLARLQASFEGQQRFIANASHELRTPLAVMRATVDVAVWLSPKRHYAIQSRLMNGSKPLVGNSLQTQDAAALPVELSTFTLEDDLIENSPPIPTFFAETVCLPSYCSVQESGFRQAGWIFALNPVDVRMSRRLPLLFRVQSAPADRKHRKLRHTPGSRSPLSSTPWI